MTNEAKKRANEEAAIVAARREAGHFLVRECKECGRLVQTAEMNGPDRCDQHDTTTQGEAR